MNIYLDIETIPSQREDVLKKIAQDISPPGNYKKAETIEQWEKETKPTLINEALRKTALNGTYGEVISIAWAINDEPVIGEIRRVEEPEGILLEKFMIAMRDAMSIQSPDRHLPVWIGHYITGFDLRFIWQRCVINRVKPIASFPHREKPWSDRIYDTKIEWTGLQSYSGDGSLDALCMAMGLAGKGDIDGSKVWDYIAVGRYKEVLQYNMEDVTKVRKIHKLMTFNYS